MDYYIKIIFILCFNKNINMKFQVYECGNSTKLCKKNSFFNYTSSSRSFFFYQIQKTSTLVSKHFCAGRVNFVVQ